MKSQLRFALTLSVLVFLTALHAQTSLNGQWLAQTDLPLSTGPVNISDAVRTANDDTYVIGNFRNGADFDTGPDTFYVRAPFAYAMFLAKYNKAGKLVFAEGMSGFGEQSYYSFNSIAADKNGNVYITGIYGHEFDFDPGPGVDSLPVTDYNDHSMFIAKYDTNGKLVWAEPIASNNNKSSSVAIATDNQSNVCITGYLYGTVNDFDPGPGVASLNANQVGEAFFAKYDANGNYLLAKLITSDLGTGADHITTDNNNNILITGSYTKGTDFDPGPDTASLAFKGGGDMFYAKYSPAGNYIFAKSVGGKGYEGASAILTDKKNNIFLTGAFSGTNEDFDPGKGKVLRSAAGDGSNTDIFLEKFDSLGNYIWVNTAGGTSGDGSTSVVADTKGNLYISGTISGSGIVFHNTTGADTLVSKGNNDVCFAKYDSSGNCIYVKQFGGAEDEFPAILLLTSQNNLLLTGELIDSVDFNTAPQRTVLYTPTNTCYFASYTNSGQFVSAQEIGDFGWFTDENQIFKTTGDKEGNTYIMGSFQGITDFDPGPDTVLLTSVHRKDKYGLSNGVDDKFFAKYDVNGKLVYVKTIQVTNDAFLNNLTADDDGNLYICGGYEGKIDFSPGSNTAVFGSDNQYTFYGFFVKYDKNGNYVFATNLKMLGAFASVVLDKKKNIYVAGNFSNKVNFNTADSSAVVTAIGGTDLFFGEYDSSGKYIYIKHIGQKGGKNTAGATDMKITPAGRMIICGELYGSKTDFDPGAGTYFLSSGKSTDSYYIAAYNLQGNFLFASAADTASTGYSYGQQLVLDGEEAVMSGAYRGIVDLDPGPKVSAEATINLASNFFIKLTSTGALLFTNVFIPTQNVDGGQNNTITGIGVDSSHCIYIAGSYKLQTDFDFGDSTAFRDTGGSYIAKYDSVGNYQYVQDFISYTPDGGYAYNYATALWVGNKNEIVLAGDGSGNLDLDPGPDSLVFHSPVYEHFLFYLAKYQETSSQQKPDFLIAQSKHLLRFDALENSFTNHAFIKQNEK